jgi:hypothetical protein
MSAADLPRVRSDAPDMSPGAGANRFFIWKADARGASEFSPSAMRGAAAGTDLRYFYGLAAELDRLLDGAGLTFLLTWHLDAFDQRFRDAVVLLIGDEKYQAPGYAHLARAVFKTGGTRRNPLRASSSLAPAIAWRVLLRELRNSLLAYRRRRHCAGPAAPLLELPMGYFGLSDVPWVRFEQRTTDVFFAGSIESTRGFTVRPRLAARRQMVDAVDAARARLPALRLQSTSSGPFANPQEMLDSETYSRGLMSAKIALCPRGNFDETFRVVEAAKSGCVAISERLPERWYNRDSPVIQLDRWSALPSVLESLLSDPQSLLQRSEQMQRWWSERLSERAVAEIIVAALSGSRP